MVITSIKYRSKLSPSPSHTFCVASLVVLVVVSFLVSSSGLSFITPSAYHFFSSSSSSSSSSLFGTWRNAPPPPPPGNVRLVSEAPAPSPAPPAREPSFSITENTDQNKKPNTDLDRIEMSLARARSAIRKSIKKTNLSTVQFDRDYIPKGPIYRNAPAFHRSYLEMEKVFKVYVYEEGDAPIFHNGPCKSIYSMEGRFINNMETDMKFRTKDPAKAHVHFLPFSVVEMIRYIYDSDSNFDIDPIKRTIVDYINTISMKYPYWNTSLGSDHFMVSCHDWGPLASTAMSELYHNSIRVLCNANITEGFDPTKDVSLPEINLKTGRLTVGYTGGPSPSKREILAFFAGGLHGPIRPVILKHWKGKDKDIQVYEYLPQDMSYEDMMRRSKFCICPSGYEVASPRVVEAIYLECVPVVISDNYSLPFNDVLNWRSFSVQVSVEDVPNLKEILRSISQRQYIRMQRRVKQVQRHFIVSSPPKRFDVFYMILHSVVSNPFRIKPLFSQSHGFRTSLFELQISS